MAFQRPARRQAAYFLLAGPAPFVSRRAFEAVTGPKREWWLVQTVGLLLTAIGVGLGAGAARDRVTPELALIGAGSAAALGGIDVVYLARRRIRATYLGDAVVEAALLAGWA